MKQFCYVVVTTDGHDHWDRVIAQSAKEHKESHWKHDTLDRLLQSGWRPVRETGMGGAGHATKSFALILLERDA